MNVEFTLNKHNIGPVLADKLYSPCFDSVSALTGPYLPSPLDSLGFFLGVLYTIGFKYD